MRETVLLVGLEPSLESSLHKLLAAEGLACVPARSESALRAVLPERVVAIVTAGRRGSLSDVTLIRNTFLTAPLIVVTHESSEDLAISALRARVAEYFRSPVADTEICAAILRLSRTHRQAALPGPVLVGSSAAMSEVRTALAQIAASDSSVLITGETGTGKELAAELIHATSARAARPLVCVNCAAIPDTLLESELFGYERGAFTGATTSSAGKMEQANGGTIFFDEIGEMTALAQAKILRAIERKEVHRLGGHRSIPLDVRVIAATNRDLDRLASEDAFRKDLYFRLNIGRVHLPPLRERTSDIPELVEHAMADLNRRFGSAVRTIGSDVMDRLLAYEWPGNVRELKNVLEGAFITRPAGRLTFEHLPDWFKRKSHAPAPPDNELQRMLRALEAANWNKSRAAGRLNWSRMTLYRKMSKYHIKPLQKAASA